MTDQDQPRKLSCPTHGESAPAFVCRHLLDTQNAPRGFFEPDHSDTPEEPQAWCEACDDMLNQEGEWNDVSEGFAGVSLVCCGCFSKLRAYHQANTH